MSHETQKQRQAAPWVHALPTVLARFHSLQVASVSFAIGGFGFILGGFGFIRIIIRCHLVIHLLPRVSHETEREPRCPTAAMMYAMHVKVCRTAYILERREERGEGSTETACSSLNREAVEY